MPAIAPQATTDPLNALIAGAFTLDERRPVPLLSTSFDVSIDAGLAIVATRRLFRNAEASSIETTITFPVPVHATLFTLEERIDGRVLTARAQRRSCARETYEDAMERGKAAVFIQSDVARLTVWTDQASCTKPSKRPNEWATPLGRDEGVPL